MCLAPRRSLRLAVVTPLASSGAVPGASITAPVVIEP